MFGIGWTEFVVIAFVLLVFVGPRHLPSMLRKTGMIINELKSASRELRNQVTEEVREIEESLGDIKSPRDYVTDLERDISDSIGSPYAEIEAAEQEMRAEATRIKAVIEAPTASHQDGDAPEEGDEPTTSASESKGQKRS